MPTAAPRALVPDDAAHHPAAGADAELAEPFPAAGSVARVRELTSIAMP